MRLAKMVNDVSVLQGMSLRQVYSRLNIATEPKSDKAAMAIAPLPRHTILATRLLGVLKTKPNTLPPELQKSYQQDLRRYTNGSGCYSKPAPNRDRRVLTSFAIRE